MRVYKYITVYTYMYILSSFILLLLYNNTFLWAIYFANLLFVASCHCCASDPVLPFKEDFMAIFCCTVSLFSSLFALPLSLLLCGMFLLFSLMHMETAYWIVSFSAFLLAFRAIYQRRHFAFNHYTHQL